jgi:ABC-type multidrug transport system fused ATPase/permease subunit
MLKIKRHLQRGRDFGRGIGQDSQEFSQIVTESLRGVRLIKMRGLEGVMIGRLREMANSLAKGQVELQRVRSLLEMTTQPILILGTFGVLYFAVEHLGMRLAELGMFMFLVTRSVPQLVQINNSRLAFYSALDSHLNMTRLSEEAAASRDVASGNAPFVGIRKKITFEDVGFNYSGDQADIPALANVSLSIERGQMVALVGPSGAGKSTLVDLIPRFYDPSTGRILIDGRPIGEYELSSLRRRIGFVMQDPVFFHDSIRANIEIGLEAPLDERKLRNCLAKSHAAEFVDRLRDGVETKIGERGLQLSAGQRQRLAIARALAQDPDILILDEPTSALDSVSESAIQASLEDLRGEITIVVIAHRLATIRNADLIVVLEGGRVADIGTHATLRSEGGTYERLVELQTI